MSAAAYKFFNNSAASFADGVSAKSLQSGDQLRWSLGVGQFHEGLGCGPRDVVADDLPYTSPHKPVIPMERFRGQGKAGAYGEFMIETDWHVGRILEFLDQERLAENTLLVFTSDNGPETTWKQRAAKFKHQSNGRYREGKRSIYEGGHRVPFLIRWPAGIAKPGRSYHGPLCQTDLLATFAEMLGAKLPAGAGEDSQSFFTVLKGQTTRERVPMIHHSSSGGFAIREGKWKLVMGAKKRKKRELYDLSSDPGESNNVIAGHPDIAKRLERAITRTSDSRRPPWRHWREALLSGRVARRHDPGR